MKNEEKFEQSMDSISADETTSNSEAFETPSKENKKEQNTTYVYVNL